MQQQVLFLLCLVAVASVVLGFAPRSARLAQPVALRMSFLDSASIFAAELFSGPAATYNGELIDKSLKLVDRVPKPAGYEYGAVANDATPIVAIGALFALVLAGVVPYFLSIGEGAQSQQREREANDKTVVNEFAIRAKKESGVKVGTKKSGKGK